MKAIEHSELLREHFIANKITVMVLSYNNTPPPVLFNDKLWRFHTEQ